MKIDALGLIEMEQSGAPGCYGDSCAESARYVTLQMLLGQYKNDINLAQLVTPAGVVRYPCPPSPYAASDTSSDQVSPLIAACALTDAALLATIKAQIVANGFRTGNGNLVELGLLCNEMRASGHWSQTFWDMDLVLQALVMRLPFAWNPNASMNPLSWFISSADQTSGYLNWINSLALARQKKWTVSCWLATKIISSKKATESVASYYRPEPNAFIVPIYQAAAAKIWR